MKTVLMNTVYNINNVKNSHRYDSISSRSYEGTTALCLEPEFKGTADWSIKF